MSKQFVRELPQKPIFGPETPKLDPPLPTQIRVWRSVAKAFTWRALGTMDTLVLSYVLIKFLDPLLDIPVGSAQALTAASYIAITEIATKTIFYFLHERLWSLVRWGSTAGPKANRDSLGRSTMKMGSWRLLASLDTFILAWFYTGNVATAFSIGGLEIFTKMAFYFLHERIWARIRFGVVRQADTIANNLQQGSEASFRDG
jgi:uncharacterized membrane protein